MDFTPAKGQRYQEARFPTVMPSELGAGTKNPEVAGDFGAVRVVRQHLCWWMRPSL